ncbi:hypothetical protein M408DRAFT_295701 [Serendipita vermifera MAFF 305830]|uniref:Uncharacterized protein n=1 Tax=Serendipita vermifera MAFF 305830 TaxID=933852 RepID=A0A0C3B0F2_SERVB|nr:hypothetical protein M408DRAFT_295701 [Serendipita vermifera MAFF 305830]
MKTQNKNGKCQARTSLECRYLNLPSSECLCEDVGWIFVSRRSCGAPVLHNQRAEPLSVKLY